MASDDGSGIPRGRALLREARRIVVLTGSGLSAASGLPSFRLTKSAYRANAPEVWDWYMLRREAIAAARPNDGHVALAGLQAARPGAVTIATQAVDDLHERAGCQGVLALHGRIHEEQWLDPPQPCCLAQPAAPGSPPRCAVCGNLRRPAISWADEAPATATSDRVAARLSQADLLVVAGERCVVAPASGFAGGFAGARGRILVVGEEPTEIDSAATLVLRGPPAKLLAQLLD